jgi:DNA-binding FadR family transcriptional regulator
MSQALPVGDSPDRRKLGEKIAEKLEKEIVQKGWPIGSVLGSEADLLARLNVSRAILREAVRVLEHHGVATMRRGPGGGLVVTAPDSDAAVRASSLVLEYMNATPEHVFEARSSLELKCVELATERIDESGIIRVRETLHLEEQAQREGRYPTHDLHTVLADLTGNPAFVLFVEVLTNLTSGSRQGERTQKTAAAARLAHDKIAEAVISGDVALARHRMQAHLAAIGTWMGKSGGSSARPKRAAAADPRP